jgi:hypothetical protein
MVEIPSPSIPAESKIVQAVAARARGLDAHARALSPLIIQDHLKSIFAKSGARSSSDLVSQIFLEHSCPAGKTSRTFLSAGSRMHHRLVLAVITRPSPDVAILA